jgi:pilus assembly protein Flp/PilA
MLRLLKDRSGASAAEYALLLAIIGAAIALSAYLLGNTIAGSMNRSSNCINSATQAACT